MFALIFFGAGLSKLRHSGLEWIFSDNMAVLLLRAQFEGKSAVPWGFFLAQHQWLTQLVAAATVAIEVGYPLALFSRRARWIIVPGAFSMQIGISLIMGITFATFLILNLFWVRWACVSSQIASGLRRLMVLRKRLSPTREN
jgi:presenilin-like A22 family membrane protease